MEQTPAFTPYGAPAANPTNNNISGAQVSATTIDILRRTKGWVRFMAVLGFIISGFMILGGIIMLVGMGALAASSGSSNVALGGAPFALIGVIYIVMAIIYIYPSIKLNKYASSIGQLINSQTTIDLETALDAQRSFWKFVGIFMLVCLSFYVLIFVFAIIGGMAGAMAT